ncbi:elongation factor P hydroxylase, partial [Escherichia coli]
MNSTHHYEQLIEIFNSCFADEFNTRLIKGDDEPIYLPADAEVPYNRIVFAHGFYASAIHEISHWCIAGKARRELVDAFFDKVMVMVDDKELRLNRLTML